MTVGGDRLACDGPVTTETADITTVKVLINSTISTEGARFCCFDVKNFYLGTPMTECEHICLHIDTAPEEITQHHKLRDIVEDGWVHTEIRRGMCGLKQAGRIANNQLKEKLAVHGCRPTRTTAGPWKHDTRPVTFALTVDDFGVKYVGKEHALHLRDALKQTYEITEDWDGKLCSGIHLDWDCDSNPRKVDLDMEGCVPKALEKLKHPHQNDHNMPQHHTLLPNTAKQPKRA